MAHVDHMRHFSKTVKYNEIFKLKYNAEILLGSYGGKMWTATICVVYSANPIYGGESDETAISSKSSRV